MPPSSISVGGNGGYSFGRVTPAAPAGLSSFPANRIVAGGTIGGNIQAGAFVFGAAGDFGWDNRHGNTGKTAVFSLRSAFPLVRSPGMARRGGSETVSQ